MKIRPKKDYKPIKLNDKTDGYERRLNYSKEILNKETIFPKPLEYEDIDKSFYKFVEEEINMDYEGVKVPTFTLYSNQKFSEYSQTWKYTDEFDNLLMNFKTINRENNPKNGSNQGGLWNIPGDRKYTLLIRDILNDNGTESYEIYSMKQPYTVDLLYKINFVTNKFEQLNIFNQRLNELFKSRQCYIRPNGHFIPMILEEINDETIYTVEEMKFYVQSCIIKAMAYIIKSEDFEITKKPKRVMMFSEGDTNNKISNIEIYEAEDFLNKKTVEVLIPFKPYCTRSEFIIDTDIIVDKIEIENIRNYRISINDTPYYTDKGFEMSNGDNIKIKINPFIEESKSQIILKGFIKGEYYTNDITESVKETQISHEILKVE